MSSDIPVTGGRSHPASGDLSAKLTTLAGLDAASLRAEWRRLYRSHPPKRAGLVAAWTETHGGAPPKGISTRLLALAAEYNAVTNSASVSAEPNHARAVIHAIVCPRPRMGRSP